MAVAHDLQGYHSEFRQFIQAVTGCGPLSGTKVDGSVGLYTQG